MTVQAPSPPRSQIVVLAALSSIAPLCTDLYLPVLPRLARDLAASASAAQLTITAVLVGIAVGQILIGPLSDRFGRRGPLLLGLAVFALANLVSAASSAVATLIVVRLVAGLAAAATVVCVRAVIADTYPGMAAARAFATQGTIMGVVPAVAPVAGGLLSRVTGWRGMFVVLAGIAAVMFAFAWRFVPETLPRSRRRSGGPAAVARGLMTCLRSRRFMAFVASGACLAGALFTYIAASSFVLEGLYRLSPTDYGFVFAVNSLGILAGANASRVLAGRVSALRLLNAGQGLCLLGATVLLASVILGAGLWGLLAGFFLTISSVGLISSNGTTLAMAAAPAGAGAAAGVLGIAQFGLGGLLAPLGGLGSSALPMALVIFICAVLGPTSRRVLLPR